MDTSLHDTQKKMDERLQRARQVGRKAFLVYTGLLGLAYDKVKSVLKDSQSLVEEAEQRGSTLAQEAGGRVETLRQQANTTVTEWRNAPSAAKKAEVAQTEVEGAVAEMESDGAPPAITAAAISELAPIEPLTGNHAIMTNEELTQPTILIASASADLSELLAAAAPSADQEITTPAESATPTILIASASADLSELLAAAAPSADQEITTPAESATPTILIASASADLSELLADNQATTPPEE